jgi:AraC-like DNA-binding protein
VVFKRNEQSIPPRARDVGDRRVRTALAIIDTDETGALTAGKVAASTNLSASRLTHLFKKEVGVSFARYVRLARYARAWKLLQNSFPSVKQVAAIVGANDVSHFIRDYKRIYGETPRQTKMRGTLQGKVVRLMFRIKELGITSIALAFLFSSILAAAQQAPKKTRQPAKPISALKLPTSLGPSQIILFKIKVRETSKSELEGLLKKEVLPYVIRSNKITGVKTYAKLIGGDFTYVAQVEVKPGVPLSFGTVFEILSDGRTAQQATNAINHLASFFEESSSSVILYRPDLSISREAFGYIKPRWRKR